MQALGGLGLFLLGMIIMTDGLRALAGKSIRRGLMRYTHTPLSGVVTGAMSTAIMQSSSATTVAAVGFVGAGLMSFSSALGIVLGANIGTTITGWLVVLVGFKLSLGTLMLPLIFIGVLLRLFSSGRVANIGYALAGFGLIFTGIGTLQEGMGELQGVISFAQLPADSFSGRLKLVFIGIIFTLITQSSSAGVAATLTALFAGMVNFQQAAVLVIGMDVGTTVTAAIATIGSSIGARRTGLSHMIFNVCNGTIALFLITPYMLLWEFAFPGQLAVHAGIALVAFHTSFNMLGVSIVLPFTHVFARFIESLLQGKLPLYTRGLDERLLKEPQLALTAVQESIRIELVTLMKHVAALLGDFHIGKRTSMADLHNALDETNAYLDKIHLQAQEGSDWNRLVPLIHALDHMLRLRERCAEQEDRAATVRDSVRLKEQRELLINSIRENLNDINAIKWSQVAERAQLVGSQIHKRVQTYRSETMHKIGVGEISVPEGTDRLEAVRWLRRVSKHLARITQHYNEAIQAVAELEISQPPL